VAAGPIQSTDHPKSRDKSAIDNATSIPSPASESKFSDSFKHSPAPHSFSAQTLMF
jgi:hypothetical protein